MASIKSWLRDVGSVEMSNVFNPYRSICRYYDKPHAARTRLSLLGAVVSRAAERGVDSIWIGRDLGYRGGRRTGLALTDDAHLRDHLERWNVDMPDAFLKGEAIAERTASIVWSELARIDESVFLWNVFPFHPYEGGNEMSNRAHTSKERGLGEELLSQLIELVRPRRLVAVGQNAHHSALRCAGRCEVRSIRHPSYGGQADFIRGLHDLYSFRSGSSPTLFD